MFLEVCEELGIQTEMLLALPEDQYIDASVAGADASWTKRFYAQLAKHPNPPLLAKSRELPRWLQAKKDYAIWQRNNLWLFSNALCRDPRDVSLNCALGRRTGQPPRWNRADGEFGGKRRRIQNCAFEYQGDFRLGRAGGIPVTYSAVASFFAAASITAFACVKALASGHDRSANGCKISSTLFRA